MPFSPLVINTASHPTSRTSVSPARTTEASSEISTPEASTASEWLGVITVAPLYLEKSLPFGSTTTGLPRAFAAAIPLLTTSGALTPLA